MPRFPFWIKRPAASTVAVRTDWSVSSNRAATFSAIPFRCSAPIARPKPSTAATRTPASRSRRAPSKLSTISRSPAPPRPSVRPAALLGGLLDAEPPLNGRGCPGAVCNRSNATTTALRTVGSPSSKSKWRNARRARSSSKSANSPSASTATRRATELASADVTASAAIARASPSDPTCTSARRMARRAAVSLTQAGSLSNAVFSFSAVFASLLPAA
mmetsp:Transcript_10457/g.30367  ORF Transcript_10457/g.30367 Transcript_10457/m.30367 type:complete len:217 (+) Transcript_10457:426-1076(+)